MVQDTAMEKRGPIRWTDTETKAVILQLKRVLLTEPKLSERDTFDKAQRVLPEHRRRTPPPGWTALGHELQAQVLMAVRDVHLWMQQYVEHVGMRPLTELVEELTRPAPVVPPPKPQQVVVRERVGLERAPGEKLRVFHNGQFLFEAEATAERLKALGVLGMKLEMMVDPTEITMRAAKPEKPSIAALTPAEILRQVEVVPEPAPEPVVEVAPVPEPVAEVKAPAEVPAEPEPLAAVQAEMEKPRNGRWRDVVGMRTEREEAQRREIFVLITGLLDSQATILKRRQGELELEIGRPVRYIIEDSTRLDRKTVLPTADLVLYTRFGSHSTEEMLVANYGREKCQRLHTGIIKAVEKAIIEYAEAHKPGKASKAGKAA